MPRRWPCRLRPSCADTRPLAASPSRRGSPVAPRTRRRGRREARVAASRRPAGASPTGVPKKGHRHRRGAGRGAPPSAACEVAPETPELPSGVPRDRTEGDRGCPAPRSPSADETDSVFPRPASAPPPLPSALHSPTRLTRHPPAFPPPLPAALAASPRPAPRPRTKRIPFFRAPLVPRRHQRRDREPVVDDARLLALVEVPALLTGE